MFKKEDYVIVKPNTQLDTGEIINNWAGQIEEIFLEDNMCLLVLDAPSINSLGDDYIKKAMEHGEDPFLRVLNFEVLELSTRRDTEEEFMESLEQLSDRAIIIEEEMDSERIALYEQWEAEFEKSDFYASLSALQKENSFIVYSFMDMVYTYEYLTPDNWTVESIQYVCLDIAPSTLTAEEEVFENYGDILIAFLNFLGSKDYIKNSAALAKGVEEIKHKIPKEAKKSENWTNSKTLMMQAKAEGIDLDDQEAVEAFMVTKQLEYLNQSKNRGQAVSSKKFGRNDKITVQYKNGNLVKDIKFKKVKKDLEEGLCTVVE